MRIHGFAASIEQQDSAGGRLLASRKAFFISLMLSWELNVANQPPLSLLSGAMILHYVQHDHMSLLPTELARWKP